MERSDLLTLSVPPEQATRLRDALRELRRAKTSSPEDVLAWMERLVTDLTTDPQQPGEVELTGPRALLHEGLLVAIDELGDSLSERCTELLRGAGSAKAVRTDVRSLDELLDLLDAAEKTG